MQYQAWVDHYLHMTSLAILLALSAPPSDPAKSIRDKGLTELGAFTYLSQLVNDIGPRLSGSENAQRAVEWGEKALQAKADSVFKVPCMVPHWVRGATEVTTLVVGDQKESLTCCALGGSAASPADGVQAEVIEVKSLKEAQQLGEKAKGKIVFYNGAFDPTLVSGFAAYGSAAGQRFAGPALAAKLGAVAALVRSMTHAIDDYPHTGVTRFEPTGPKIPAIALSTVAANRLHDALQKGKAEVNVKTSCETLPDAPSFSVVAEITGSEKPNEVVVVGGHLDSWDKGRGAHDDGAGVCQSMEVVRLIKELGLKPKRTIRAVLFMNEENGGRGAAAFADFCKGRKSKERVIAAIESDSGGFAPRGFGVSLKPRDLGRLGHAQRDLAVLEAGQFNSGGEGGADVGPLGELGAVLFGLEVESQRYFDYHHSDKDTLDKVNPRELELGAVCMATLAWRLAEEGI